jgi:ubiquinone/menaquinone biosynthesis C-methylase UbiE
VSAGFRDHFSGHAAAYARARPTYPAELFQWLASQSAGHALAWDAGTGNGQAAVALAAHYTHIHATDASAPQIAAARPHPAVHYAVEPAEHCSLPDASADLVLIAQALHWLDIPAFHAEVGRVLKPEGLYVAVCYGLLTVSPEVDRRLQAFEHGIVGSYWPPERALIDAAYAGIAFPGHAVESPPMDMAVDWTLDALLDYLGSWSAVQRYRRALGQDPLADLAPVLRPCWGEGPRRVRWPLTVVARRGAHPSAAGERGNRGDR